MKRSMLMMVLCGIMAGVATAADKPIVALATAGNVSPDLVSRVQAWVDGNIGPVTNCGAVMLKAKTVEGAVEKLASSLRAAPVALVLAASVGHDSRRAAMRDGVVVLNLSAMKPDDLSTAAAKETFARRVESEAVGQLAFALGLPVCLLPRCALYTAPSLADLDHNSRNLCPPCYERLQTRLQAFRR